MATLTDGEIVSRLRSLAAEIEGRGAPKPAPDPSVAPEPPSPAAPQPGPLAWSAKVSPTLRERVRLTGKDFGFDPNWLMACMAFETGRTFSPSKKNPQSSATGLIQFMEATAKSMGTTTAALAKMTAETQFDFVWLYFRDRIRERGPIRNLGDCYMAILNPVAMGKPDSFRMWLKGAAAYRVNAGLDVDRDGSITRAEATSKVYALLAEGLKPENAS